MLSLKLLRVMRPIGRPVQSAAALAVLFAAAGTADAAVCPSVVKPVAGSTYEVSVNSSTTVGKMPPEFFGFNVEWVEFQMSLWDAANQRVKPDAVEYLKAFPGAVYRYPGGTEANYFEWKNAIGDVASRKPQRAVTWTGPMVAKFGLVEYLNFVQSVKGQPWYVLNLYGSLAGERPAAEMAKEAGGVAAFFHQQALAGKPRMFRYELGNELDRAPYMWRPEKYTSVAGAALAAVSAADPGVPGAAISQDYDASWQLYGITGAAYNRYVAQNLKPRTTEFVSHRYYDGPPWGPPVPHEIQQECGSINALGLGLLTPPAMWITEHAKTPESTPDDPNWQKNWPHTADLSAAISISDTLIAFAQIPEVYGAFTHALHATSGPWPMFHPNTTGGVVPSAVYWGMRMLREGMLDEVVATRTISANQSGFAGGYDFRAAGFANLARNKFSVWMINRAKAPVRVKLTMPALAGYSIYSTASILSSSDPSINNYGGVSRISPRKVGLKLVFDGAGTTYLDVPANAVMTVALTKSTTTTTPTYKRTPTP